MIIKIMKARLILMMLCAPLLCGAALDIKEIDHIGYRFDGNIQGYKKKGGGYTRWHYFDMLENLHSLVSFIVDEEKYVYLTSLLLLKLPINDVCNKRRTGVYVDSAEAGINWRELFLAEKNLKEIENISGLSKICISEGWGSYICLKYYGN